MNDPNAWLKLDPEQTIEKIAKTIRHQVRTILRKKGAIIAVSGGIDSSVCAALCVKALGKENILALSLPERDSSSDSTRLGRKLTDALGVTLQIVDIAPVLKGARCYELQLEAIRRVFPEYGRQNDAGRRGERVVGKGAGEDQRLL